MLVVRDGVLQIAQVRLHLGYSLLLYFSVNLYHSIVSSVHLLHELNIVNRSTITVSVLCTQVCFDAHMFRNLETLKRF